MRGWDGVAIIRSVHGIDLWVGRMRLMGVGRWVPHVRFCMGMKWVADESDHMLGGNEDDRPFVRYCGSRLQLESEPYEHEGRQ
jgi:hypothetical protein